MFGPKIRIPAGPITPVGAAELLRGNKPIMAYRSFDDTVVFNLIGPLAIFDRTMPERIQLNSLKGLIPPWQNIEQKSATQDGSTYVTSLYDPIEIDMVVTAYGRSPAYRRKTTRLWLDSWDAKRAGELSWQTWELGRWWAPVRWAKQPVDPMIGGTYRHQRFGWVAKAYDGFWRSYDHTDAFGMTYAADSDAFTTDYTSGSNLGPDWTIGYYGAVGGHLYANGIAATNNLAPGQGAIARLDYTSTSDDQVVTVTFGNMPADWLHYGYNDIWLRMNTTGTPGTDGVRLRIGNYQLTLSYFIGGHETVLRTAYVAMQPLKPGDQITVIAGINGSARNFVVQYAGNVGALGWVEGPISPRKAVLTLMTVVETDTGSPVGPAYRGAGFGIEAETGSGNLPADVLDFAVADNTAAVADSGYVTRVNAGDQPMWDRFVLIGPGTFTMGNGPGSSEYVTMGPLNAGQIVYVRTDPRRRGVVDLTAIPQSPQQLADNQAIITELQSLWSNFSAIADPPDNSIFGVQEPQGNLYSLLNGRFSQPIPPKPPGGPAIEYQVPVSITGGGPDSAILVAGTPLRRYPE